MADRLRGDGLVSENFRKLTAEERAEIARSGTRHVPEASPLGEKLLASGIPGVRNPREHAHIHVAVCDRMAANEEEVETGDRAAYRPSPLFAGGVVRTDLEIDGGTECPSVSPVSTPMVSAPPALRR
jgi:hypothetical protein